MTSESDGAAAPANKRRVRLSLSIVLWLLAAVALVAFAILQLVDHLDPGLRNLASFSTLGFAMIMVWCWFVARAPVRWGLRRGVAIVTVVLLLGAAAIFRIDGVSGDMIPRLSYRWTTEADRQLKLPVATSEAPGSARYFSVTTEHDYPQFLGPSRRATLAGPKLATDWNQRPPKLLWKREIGAGWSAFAIVGDHAVTQEQRGEQALVTAYDLRTGKILWAHADPGRFTSVVGGDGPRATPTVVDGKIYTLGADGLLNCLDGATGEVLWSHNVIEETGGQQVNWGRSSSPLVVDQRVIVPAGGPGHSLVAYDKDTGKLVWAAGDDQVSYASPVLAELHGVRQVLTVNQDWLVSHRLDDGQILFRHEWPGSSDANASTSQPVPLDGNRILLSKGYGIGSQLVQVHRDADGTFSTETLWAEARLLRTKLTNVVIRDGYAYGLSDGVLECLDLDRGKRMWKRGRYGHGQVLLVDDLLLVTSEQGKLALVEATPEAYRELAEFDALEGKTWNNPALSGNLLLVRNAEEAACYELPVESSGAPQGAEAAH